MSVEGEKKVDSEKQNARTREIGIDVSRVEKNNKESCSLGSF
jgi:hypothetical protein